MYGSASASYLYSLSLYKAHKNHPLLLSSSYHLIFKHRWDCDVSEKSLLEIIVVYAVYLQMSSR